MGKNKKKDVYEEAEREGTTIEDYIIPQKVQAFIDAYEPVEQQKFATTIFDETKLRAFFKAYITTLGDPLVVYLTRLEDAGFKMQVSTQNEPAIFVTEKAVGGFSMLEEL
jgi:hypothetical protein